MKPYKAQWFESPINLPAGTSGRMEIRRRVIPVGEEVIIVGRRQAILRGIKPIMAKTEKPLRIHQLFEANADHPTHPKIQWMTDLPEELNQIGELIYTLQPQGKVLVGGLGLGILATTVARLEKVSKVVVVERSRDVIKLCANKVLYRTTCSDILKYLQTTKDEYDFYLLDTWAGTNEATWWDEVMPLRRIIRNRYGSIPTIHCWAEDIMWAQIGRSLTRNPPHWHTTYLDTPMAPYEADAFLNEVGTEWWEKKYGAQVDRYINETKYPKRRQV